MTITIPTVHWNGTNGEDLLKQQLEVVHKAQNLLRALSVAAPHGRDYYPQGNDAIIEALKEQEKRYSWVNRIIKDAETIAIAIDKQLPEKRRST